VRVFNRNGRVCYGTFLTVPDTRLNAMDGPSVTFEERAASAPEAVKSWLYPGDETARAFIYPHEQSSH
jgi:hypothetical protein